MYLNWIELEFLKYSDCTEITDTTDDSTIPSTTESVDSTTLPFTFESTTQQSDLDEIENFTFESQSFDDDDDESTTDDLEIETTTTPQRSARKKRHINYHGSNTVENNAYTMEVMVAVDRKMQEYHGNNIQAYVLTLMSIVSNIYADASIGNSINVAVVHILLLNDDMHMESNHVGKWNRFFFSFWFGGCFSVCCVTQPS